MYCGILGYEYSLGVSGVLYTRRRWIELDRGSEQFNSIVDRGPGACIGHTLRVPMSGTSVPVGGTNPSGSEVV